MPKKTFAIGDVLTASDVNTYLMNQSVMVFATAAARTTAIPSPTEGMVTYLQDTNTLQTFDGSAWGISLNQSVSTSASPSFVGITASTGQIIAPAQYCYNGDNTGGIAISYSTTPVIPPTTYFNVGSAFNTGNGRFTVPVAGYVFCSFNSLITRNLYASHAYVHFAVDGVRKSVTTHTVYDIGGNYQTLNNTAIVYCPANSYVTAVLTTPQASAYQDQFGLGLTYRFLG